MKVFLTVSIEEKDLKLKVSDEQIFRIKIRGVVDSVIGMMKDEIGVQLKLTNLPPRKGEM